MYEDYYYEDEKLYSTGFDDLDDLLEKAFCDGYEYAQREFADSLLTAEQKQQLKEFKEEMLRKNNVSQMQQLDTKTQNSIRASRKELENEFVRNNYAESLRNAEAELGASEIPMVSQNTQKATQTVNKQQSKPNSNNTKKAEGFFEKNWNRTKRLYTGKSKFGKTGQVVAIAAPSALALGTGVYGIKKHSKNKK